MSLNKIAVIINQRFPSLLLTAFFLTLPLAGLKISVDQLVLYPPEIILVMLIMAVFANVKLRKKFLSNLTSIDRRLLLGVVLLILGGVVGAYCSPIFPQSIGALKSWLISPVLFFFVIALVLSDYEKLLLYGVLTAGVIMSLIGLVDYFFVGHPPRLLANFNSPNYFGGAVGPICLLAIWQALKAKKQVFLHILVVVILVSALLLSRSIGSWLGLLTATVLLLVNHREYRLPLVVPVLIVLAIFGVMEIKERTSIEDNSWEKRRVIWATTAYMINEKPLLGTGLRGFEEAYARALEETKPTIQEANVPQPHNLLISFWANVTLIGLVGIIIFVGTLWENAYQITSGWKYAFVAVLTHGLIDTPYWQTQLVYLFWMYLAGIYIVTKRRPRLELIETR